VHIPDGFIDAPTSLAFGAATVAAVGLGLKGAKRTLSEKAAPMAGLTAVYIFAAQMINFPVASGTSGHLIGGALAAILVGPYAGLLAMTVVLIIQSLMFADGGLSAIGLNVFNMGVITVVVGWLTFKLFTYLLPRRTSSVVAAAFLAAFISVPASAAGFVAQYAIGGTATFSINTVLAAMISVHVLIGIGEAVITAMTVSAVLAVRPDLVYGAKNFKKKLEIKSVELGAPQ
jgi:cobalamin biosynthesis protein CbiM